jgi:hypothetical protein
MGHIKCWEFVDWLEKYHFLFLLCIVVMEVVMARLFVLWKLCKHIGPCALHSCYGSENIS